LFLIALAQRSHEFQARLSRIFLATIPVESISKVRSHSSAHALKSVHILSACASRAAAAALLPEFARGFLKSNAKLIL
jgi:hypothetical protein